MRRTSTPHSTDDQKARRLADRFFSGEMFTATAMARYENAIQQAVVLSLFIPLIISVGRQQWFASVDSDHSLAGLA